MKKVLLAGLLCAAWAAQAYALVDVDVSSMVQVNRGVPINNYVTKQTSVSISVKNISAGELQLPIRVSLDSISPSSISCTNADGTNGNGKPYFLMSLGGSSVLRPGETSSTKAAIFNNPSKLRFNFTTKTYISVNAEGAAFIGSASGGSVVVSDPLSPLYGVSVGIPAGSLPTDSSIAISQEINPPPPPPSAVYLGPSINFSTSNNFIGSVGLKIPIPPPSRADLVPVAKYYNGTTNLWEELPSSYNYVDGYMTVITSHFSLISIFYEILSDYTNSLPTNIDINTDSLKYQNEDPHPALISGVSFDTGGYCAGMSAFAKWYYENKGHGIRCKYDTEPGKEISAYVHLNNVPIDLSTISSAIQYGIDLISDGNAVFNYMLKNNRNKTLARIGMEGKDNSNKTYHHVVLIAGWKSYVDNIKDLSRPIDEIGYFEVLDGNDNKQYGLLFVSIIYDRGFRVVKYSYSPRLNGSIVYNKIFQSPIESSLASKISNKYDEYESIATNWCPPPPIVQTTGPSYPGTHSVTLNGTVNPNGVSTEAWFEWGLDPTLATSTETVPHTYLGPLTSSQPVSYPLSGLDPHVPYYYRVVASNGSGTPPKGIIQSFGPPLATPIVFTGSTTSITSNGATLNGSANPNGLQAEAWFEYGTDATFSIIPSSTPHQYVGSGIIDQPVVIPISGLSAGMTYYYRIAASNVDGPQRGDVGTFTTVAAPNVFCKAQFTRYYFPIFYGPVTFTAQNSPYLIDGDLALYSGAVLTIEPGVVIKFGTWYHYGWYDWAPRLYGSGRLEARGTAEHPIIFTSAYDNRYCDLPYSPSVGNFSNNPQNWGGISVYGSAAYENAYMSYVGGNGSGLIPLQ